MGRRRQVLRIAVVSMLCCVCSREPVSYAATAPLSPRAAGSTSQRAAGSTSQRAAASREQRAAPELRVSVTFDDLGVSAASVDPKLSERILSALAAGGAPVAVFANCKALAPGVLSAWERAGATIGNHTDTHLSVDVEDAAGQWEFARWWADVERCDGELRRVLGKGVRFFRFPYLRYGSSPARRDHAQRRLAAMGYSIAHVTAATSEWLLAQYYDRAAGDGGASLRDEIRRAYVEHMVESLEAARRMALQKHGRHIAQITLLHVNSLAADHLPEVFRAWKSRGWTFSSLEAALEDSVYSLPDEYAGGCGCSWLARTAPSLKRSDAYVFGDYEEALRARFDDRVKALPSP